MQEEGKRLVSMLDGKVGCCELFLDHTAVAGQRYRGTTSRSSGIDSRNISFSSAPPKASRDVFAPIARPCRLPAPSQPTPSVAEADRGRLRRVVLSLAREIRHPISSSRSSETPRASSEGRDGTGNAVTGKVGRLEERRGADLPSRRYCSDPRRQQRRAPGGYHRGRDGRHLC